MESFFDIIEYVPDSPIILPEWPKESLGVINTDGYYMYSKKEGDDVEAVKKDGYYKAEYFSIYGMREGANNYVSNPSVDFDIHKIIFAGKERSAKYITMTKDVWKSDMVHDLFKINQSTDIDPKFLNDLSKKNIRLFVGKVLSKKVSQ